MSEAGQQVRGQGDDLGPRDVDRPLPRGPPVQAEVLGLFDVVLEVDMGAVPRVEPADLPDTGVGGDELVAAPELFLPFGGPLAVAGVQRLVAHHSEQRWALSADGEITEEADDDPARGRACTSRARGAAWGRP